MEMFGILLIAVGVYFIPALVAALRDHPNGAAISVLNLFLGWTFIGWVVALVWAVMAINAERPPQHPSPPGSPPA